AAAVAGQDEGSSGSPAGSTPEDAGDVLQEEAAAADAVHGGIVGEESHDGRLSREPAALPATCRSVAHCEWRRGAPVCAVDHGAHLLSCGHEPWTSVAG